MLVPLHFLNLPANRMFVCTLEILNVDWSLMYLGGVDKDKIFGLSPQRYGKSAGLSPISRY